MTATAAPKSVFYLGTYTTDEASQGIYLGQLDRVTGGLAPLTLAATARNPSFLALSPDGRFLYAVVEENVGQLAAFRVEADYKLAPLNTVPTGGAHPCHVAADATGKYVLVANYSSGSIACFRVNGDGSLGERAAFVQFTGSGPDASRQKGPHAHSIYFTGEDRFVYSCDLGADNIDIFKFDAAKGALLPSDPPAAKVAPGGGPRHLAFHPEGKFVYANNELNNSVMAFSRNAATGALAELQTISTLPEERAAGGVTGAAIFCHPSGKWLYVSNRGDESITLFAIRADGRLAWVETAPAQVVMPRGFGIDPSGNWLISAGEKDGRIAALKIDQTTGKLTWTGQSARAGAPTAVLFIPTR